MATPPVESVESRRQVLQSQIDNKKSFSERNKLGQFATPNALALQIAKYARSFMDGLPIHFSDPAIGTGSFYSALLNVFPTNQIASATGVEIDPSFAAAARQLWNDFGLEVIEGDFTEQSPNRRHNLILTNPPYIRHHHLSLEQKQRLKKLALKATNLSVNGLAGFYVYYLLLADQWMDDGGIATWLIPSEFMDVNYGRVLKEYLTRQVTLISIHRFDPNDVQFDDALVSSAVVVFRKCPPDRDASARFTYGGSIDQPHLSEEVPLDELYHARKWTAYPRAQQVEKESCELVLSDLFKIQRGVATGNNRFFILTRDKARELNLPEEWLRPILPPPRLLKQTVVESDPDGFPQLNPQLVLVGSGLPEERIKETYPSLWRYLESAKDKGILDGYLVKHRKPWYKQEERSPAPFVCTYMGRSKNDAKPFRFIWNKSQAVAANVYHVLYPIGVMAQIMAKGENTQKRVFDLLQQITGEALKSEGRVYGGGLHKIEPKELGRIPATAFLRAFPELSEESGDCSASMQQIALI